MPSITLPYALINVYAFNIKEISRADFLRVSSTLDQISRLKSQKFVAPKSWKSEYDDLVQKKRKEINDKSKQYTYALNRLNAFKSEHRDILARGEQMHDSDYDPCSFFDVLIGRTPSSMRYDFFQKHKAIFDQYSKLQNEVLKLQWYAPENLTKAMNSTMELLANNYEYKKKTSAEQLYRDNRSKEWDLRRQIQFTSGYAYLVENMRIDTIGVQTTISGRRRHLVDVSAPEFFNTTLINKQIQITR